MNIQLVVPTKGCVNNCPFCCSKMHDSPYDTSFNDVELEKRIKYAVMHNIDTCVLTGTGEVLQNGKFLEKLVDIFNKLDHPFPNVEVQTTGVMLEKYQEVVNGKSGELTKFYYNIDLLKRLRVNTISLSISDLLSSRNNCDIIGVHNKFLFQIPELVDFLKANHFNVRLSLNVLNTLDGIDPGRIFKYAKTLGADQISFKKMYINENDQYQQNKWIADNKCHDKTYTDIEAYVLSHGRHMYTLEFGSKVYSVMGLSTVVVDDCMAVGNNDIMRYIILRENGKLYCHWDDEGSLIF